MKRPALTSADRALERGALSMVLGLRADAREDRDGLFASIACADDALRGPAYSGERSVKNAFVNFHAKYSIWQSEFGRHQEANDALNETSQLIEGVPELPLLTRIDHLTSRAWMRSLAPRTALAAARDIDTIHDLGLANGVPNALWTAKYFRALRLRVQGQTDASIDLLNDICTPRD